MLRSCYVRGSNIFVLSLVSAFTRRITILLAMFRDNYFSGLWTMNKDNRFIDVEDRKAIGSKSVKLSNKFMA